jgi:hypothetical protein
MGKDWRKAFTPPTNQHKLDNGAFLGWGMFRALQTIHLKFKEDELLAPFEGFITSQMLASLRDLLPMRNPYSYLAEQFVCRTFPFNAYAEKEDPHV